MTFKNTLTSKSKYFQALLLDTEEKEYFIDRDPDLFKNVLAYLRNSKYEFRKESLPNLRLEFEYLGIETPPQMETRVETLPSMQSILKVDLLRNAYTFRGTPSFAEVIKPQIMIWIEKRKEISSKNENIRAIELCNIHFLNILLEHDLQLLSHIHNSCEDYMIFKKIQVHR